METIALTILAFVLGCGLCFLVGRYYERDVVGDVTADLLMFALKDLVEADPQKVEIYLSAKRAAQNILKEVNP